ncbi:MAG: hypothetical protein QW063_00475 [Candidatus Nanoarchaeia archaeon]
MAIKIPPLVIFALIMVGLMIYFGILPFFQVFFGGPEYTAQKTIAEQLNLACSEEPGFSATFSVFMPDSKGARPPDIDFLSLAIDKQHLLLIATRYGVATGDIISQFQDFLSCTCTYAAQALISKYLNCNCKEGVRVLKDIPLEECRKRNIQLCGNFDTTEMCDTFSFESQEGKENLQFIVKKIKQGNKDKVILSYNWLTVCGDNRCCEGENELNCPVDCKDGKPCKVFT